MSVPAFQKERGAKAIYIMIVYMKEAIEMTSKSRKIKLNKNYQPLPVYEGDEIFRNGIFLFNISRILDDINAGILQVEEEQIHVEEWFRTNWHGSINEEHLPTVDVTKTVLQAEIRPGMFKIIDGNHRMERAFRERIMHIHSYKLKGEQLLPYFKKVEGYAAFVDYWNSKL
jgi:hypothetical protein